MEGGWDGDGGGGAGVIGWCVCVRGGSDGRRFAQCSLSAPAVSDSRAFSLFTYFCFSLMEIV